MINYSLIISKQDNLEGFFVGWPNPPSSKTLIKILKGSYKYIVAKDDNKVIGFITAISDGILSAYIPFLEVLPEYQSCGVGKQLVSKMRDELSHLYMIDLICDSELIPFYEKLGMSKSYGAIVRNYEMQNGEKL